MLSKVWKNLLLVICVVAILFNITSKLVKRTNLVSQLKSVIGGTSISDFFDDEETTINKNNNIVDKTNGGNNPVKITIN